MPTRKSSSSHAAAASKVNLRRIAKLQRWLVWVILSAIISVVGLALTQSGSMPVVELVIRIVYVLLYVGAIILAGLLAFANGRSVVHIVGLLAFMLIPLLNLLFLAAESSKSTQILKRAGLKVGLAGVSPEQLHKLTEGVCTACGYNLVGLDGSICPECGLEKPLAMP